jgi:gliding motility-associated-like protein
MRIRLTIAIIILMQIHEPLFCQTIFGYGLGSPSMLLKVETNFSHCYCTTCCNLISISANDKFGNGMTMSQDGRLFGNSGDIWLIDTINGNSQLYFDLPQIPNEMPYIQGIATMDGNIFYTITDPEFSGDFLYKIDVPNSTVNNLGPLPYPSWRGDLTFFNGEAYYVTRIGPPPYESGVVHLDLNNPVNSSIVVIFPYRYVTALSATDICNVLMALDIINNEVFYINLIDGAVTTRCEMPQYFAGFTSLLEFETPTICAISLDLDCNDSSGATESDFNSPEYDCLSDGVQISDDDIGMQYDAIIASMTIQISGSVPDAPNEVLISTGAVPNINVSGSGTSFITLINVGGGKSTDFKDALKLIQYTNNESPLTPGQRTVDVQFTTESGAQSNIATAFIDVISLPLVDVDLGADLQACEGESVTFDAGHPGADYTWSTGEDTQIISVDASGQYSVTVSDGINCPGRDTIELTILPVINVSLSGDTEICDNEPAQLIINTDSPFPLTIEISADPGNPFSFSDVTDNYPFTDLPAQSTNYTITSAIPSQEACITVTDAEQFIDVYPSYVQSLDVALCDGDSIWLGYYWETEAGEYENTFNTLDGCDSIVTTTISILPAINITQQSTTCDSSLAGVFFQYLSNPNGCDTVIQTTVNYLPADTTMITQLSCNSDSIGITTQLLTNQSGCDSVIITITTVTAPQDTTLLFQTTCDSSLIGASQHIETNQAGCDSLIITTISIAPSDTTYVNGISCDSALIGITQTLYNNSMGCDSLVITTIDTGIPDTTYLFSTSCDSASLGVFQTNYTTTQQCDSLVVTTITFSAQDSTFSTSSSCDPSEAGIFIRTLMNAFGCDSIVTETVTLLPSDTTGIVSTTCDPVLAGVFTSILTNQYGCDSIVTETVTLLPSDATLITGTTCTSSEAGMFITTHLNQYGCDSIVTLTVTLIPSDTTILSIKTCDPTQVGNSENLYIGQDGCDSLVIAATTLYPLPQLNLLVTSDFNGYPISCFGEHDGSLEASIVGEDPFQYLWSTGDTTQSITGLGTGDYDVLITDANGCQASGSITLSQPEAFTIGFEVSQPDCFTNEDGSITVLQSGGVSPVRYSKDGINYQSSPTFSDLPAGSYTITALDANDCEVKEIIMINVSIDINVDLGDDQVIIPGDTALIQALVNVPFDSLASITWTGLINPDCPTCLTQLVTPIITTAYTVSVSDAHGCSAQDSMNIFVERNIAIYVPNVFSPNGDGINDRLLISAGTAVQEIESFTVFDRWGNMVYLNEHFLPNDPGEAWDGKHNGVTLNPGVYAFKMLVRFADGTTQIRYGDVTVMR